MCHSTGSSMVHGMACCLKWCLAITWINDHSLFIGPLGTEFSGIFFSLKKKYFHWQNCIWKFCLNEWWPFCLWLSPYLYKKICMFIHALKSLLISLNTRTFSPVGYIYIYIWVRSRNCGCLVTWFCYQLIAKPGNKTAAVSWPDPYIYMQYSLHISW